MRNIGEFKNELLDVERTIVKELVQKLQKEQDALQKKVFNSI